jgi:hypothetical protein
LIKLLRLAAALVLGYWLACGLCVLTTPHAHGAEAAKAAAAGIDPTAAPYNAAGNGTTNDTAALQAALTAAAAAGVPVLCGGHDFAVTSVTVSAAIEGGSENSTCITQLGSNNNVLVIPAGAKGVELANFQVWCGAGATANTSGACIWDAGTQTRIVHVVLVNPYWGIEDDDTFKALYQHLDILPLGAPSPGWRGIVIGKNAYASAAIEDVVMGPPAGEPGSGSADIELVNAGSVYLAGNDLLYAQNGTLVDPGAGQSVDWTMAVNTAFGDTTAGPALLIAPQKGGTVNGFFATQGWVGQAGYATAGFTAEPGVEIDATAGAVKGVHLLGLRAFSNGGDGVFVTGAAGDVEIAEATICGNGQAEGAGIHLQGAVAVHVRGGIAGTDCDGSAVAPTSAGVLLDGVPAASLIDIEGIDVSDPNLAAPIATQNGALPMEGVTILGNRGLDDVLGPQIAAAAAIDTGFYPAAVLSGNGTISTVAPVWDGREIALSNGGAGTMALGTACGGAVALSPYQMTRFHFSAGWNCWSHMQ